MKRFFNDFHRSKNPFFCLFILLCSVAPLAAQKISGYVRDAATSEPIIGASVLLKGSAKGTISDTDGNYTLDLNENEQKGTLVISFVGYETQEVAINGQTTVNIALKSGKNLEEVVVTGVFDARTRLKASSAISIVTIAA